MSLEIEQKFPIDDAGEFLARVAALTAEELSEVEQSDTYYNHPERDFRLTDEAMRIRRTHEGAVVTYKGPKQQSEVKTRREIELVLAEPEAWPELFEALGFREVATVAKRRRRFRVRRDGFEVELTLDNVTDLGQFAEIEIVADEAQGADAQEVIRSLARELALGEAEKRSYLSMLMAQRGE
ncbi:class IV adenylate cyclase [Aeoliella sp. SH292]|uniref:class IV adenylate cyclase n=1 Tax=Aeoliella sp. SH292 TaxID=3454464 RepID=UPI003F946767